MEEIPPNSQFQLCGSRRKLKLLLSLFLVSSFPYSLNPLISLQDTVFLRACVHQRYPGVFGSEYETLPTCFYHDSQDSGLRRAGRCYVVAQHFQEPAYQGLEELSVGPNLVAAGPSAAGRCFVRPRGSERPLRAPGFLGVSWSVLVNFTIFSGNFYVTKSKCDSKEYAERIKKREGKWR